MERRRYLFGPVDDGYALDNLGEARASGECKVFAPSGRPDVLVRHGDAWEDVLARLPDGWGPDFLVLFLAYRTIPPALWEAPLPRIGLAADWDVLWHRYRHAIPRCDLVFTDARGVRLLRRAGATNGEHGNLFGCARPFLDDRPPAERDIDVLYVGSLHPAHKRERLPWLGRVVRALGDDWNVVVRTDVDRVEYLELLRRARIVFNRSIRGECNLRTFETVAAGGLLFQEAENEEVRRYLRPADECVLYTGATVEPLLRRYLADEPERARIAAAGRARAASFGFAELWRGMLETIDERRPDLVGLSGEGDELLHRFWETFTASTGPDRCCDADDETIERLEAALERRRRPELHLLLGLAIARRAQRLERFDRACVADVARRFRQAVDLAPTRPIFRLDLAEALWRLGRESEAALECRRALDDLNRADALAPGDLELAHFPPAFDTFRVEWERAAWADADERSAKRRLVRWRLHSLLATLTDDLAHYRAAASLRDDLWVSHAALGRALVRAGRPSEGAEHLRRAAELNPFDERLLPELLGALRATGDDGRARAAAEELRLLRRAAPTTNGGTVAYAQEVVA